MAKSKLVKKVDLESGSVLFQLEDGTEYQVAVVDLPQNMVDRLVLHGLSQKLGDCFAGKSLAEGKARFEVTRDNLVKGIWAASGGSDASVLIIQAIANVTGSPVADVRARWAAMTQAQRGKVKRDPTVMAEWLRLEQERLPKEQGTDGGILGELFGTGGDGDDADDAGDE